MNSFQGTLSPIFLVKHDMGIKNTVNHDIEDIDLVIDEPVDEQEQELEV